MVVRQNDVPDYGIGTNIWNLEVEVRTGRRCINFRFIIGVKETLQRGEKAHRRKITENLLLNPRDRIAES